MLLLGAGAPVMLRNRRKFSQCLSLSRTYRLPFQNNVDRRSRRRCRYYPNGSACSPYAILQYYHIHFTSKSFPTSTIFKKYNNSRNFNNDINVTLIFYYSTNSIAKRFQYRITYSPTPSIRHHILTYLQIHRTEPITNIL